jgi:CHAT domain-containing protein/tetratricopeptide (TPR) repeat protein
MWLRASVLLVLAAVPIFCFGQATTEPLLTFEQKEKLKQRDALKSQVRKLEDQAKMAEALPLIEKIIVLEKATFGASHDDIAGSLTWLAEVHEELGDFTAARRARLEALEMYSKLHGARDWRATTARFDLKRAELLGSASVEKRARFCLAVRLAREADKLAEKRSYAAAEKLHRQVLDTCCAIFGEDDPVTATNYGTLAANLNQQGKHAAVTPLLEKALALNRRLLGDEHPDTAQIYNNLGLNLNARCKYAQAAALYEKALASYRKIWGEEHPSMATCYNNLALNLNAQGKYADAETIFEKALALRRRLLGEQHADTSTSYHNLALNLEDQGKYADAGRLCEKSLAISRRVLGEEHPDTGLSYLLLAGNLRAEAKYAEAARFYEKAEDILGRALGQDHPQTVSCYSGRALNLSAQGKYSDAAPLLKKVLDIRRNVLGEEHPDTATSYDNLGVNLHDLGKYADAASFFQTALRIRRQLLGDKHPSTVRSYNNLAWNLGAQAKYGEATIYYERALSLRCEALGEEHHLTALSYSNLAAALSAQGKYADAGPLFRNGLAICRKVLGETHPQTALSYSNLAANLNAQGKYAEAAPLYENALAIRRKVLTEQHPDTALSYSNLAGNLRAHGKYSDATVLYEKALAIYRKSLGEEYPETATAYNNLAGNLDAQLRFADAALLHEKALAIRLKRLGEEHPDTAVSYNNVGSNFSLQGKHTEAARYFEKALASRPKFLGEGHPDTVGLYLNLAYSLNAQGKYADAEVFCAKAADSFAVARLRSNAGGLERSSFAAKYSPFALLAACRARNGKARAAWDALEGGLARGLLEDLSSRQPLSLTPSEEKQQQELNAALDLLDKQIAKLLSAPAEDQAVPDELKKLISKRQQAQAALARLAAALAERQVYTLPDIQRKIPTDAALLTWIDISASPMAADPNGEHWACLLRRTGPPRWVKLPGRGPKDAWTAEDDALPVEIRSRIARWGNLKELKDLQSMLLLLAKQRLDPLHTFLNEEGDLRAVKHLLVHPVGWMAGIPVEVMPGPYTISYVPSGTMFAKLREKRERENDSSKAKATGLLALGDPVFQKREALLVELDPVVRASQDAALRPLPGTRVEVEAISKLFPNPRILLGSDASEQRLDELAAAGKLKQFRYIHLATHGAMDGSRGLESSLFLAEDNLPDPVKQRLAGKYPYDGRLTALEIVDRWKLDADLVTLSACQTGLGTKAGGEGYVGFTQALFLAEARSVVLSLWKVDDAATSLLMQRLYQNLLGKRASLDRPLTKAKALAEAKSWLRGLTVKEVDGLVSALPRGPERTRQPAATDHGGRPFAHPYYWAAFILIGDPE